jgi:serine protease AprX
VEVACATNNLTAVYHKTSGATAHAGGTAAVLRNFVRGSAPDVEPGHVYAGMILGGSHSGGSFDDIEGAGRLKLSPPPGTSNAIYRRFTTTNAPGTSVGVSVFITVPATTPANCRLSAALWWGEVKGAHNDYDLTLVDPNGVVRATSASGRSVFELARVGAPLTTGVWQVKVKPFKPVIGSQKVYAAVSTCR